MQHRGSIIHLNSVCRDEMAAFSGFFVDAFQVPLHVDFQRLVQLGCVSSIMSYE